MRDRADEGVPRAQIPQHLRGAVEAAVVHDDELAGVGERQQRVARLADQLGKVFGLVFGGNEHAHFGRDGPGGEAHRRLRMRAGRTPSWSRYFATVRRAILTPFCANISTICWSVSGFLGSSSATIFSFARGWRGRWRPPR